jgi:hypothetical protein
MCAKNPANRKKLGIRNVCRKKTIKKEYRYKEGAGSNKN